MKMQARAMGGFRVLNDDEIIAVSGGADDAMPGDIVVTGARHLIPDRYRDTLVFRSSYDIGDFGSPSVGDGGAGGDGDYGFDGGGGLGIPMAGGDNDAERSESFKDTAQALLRELGPVLSRAFAATLQAIRDSLVDLLSIENKEAASNWFDQNIRALTNWITSNADDGPNTADNPIDNFRSLFGIPTSAGID